MEKLKTLKDLDWDFGLMNQKKCIKNLLRAEAIKWIKHWTNEEPPAYGISKEMEILVIKLAGKKEAFIEFFNIEESELK